MRYSSIDCENEPRVSIHIYDAMKIGYYGNKVFCLGHTLLQGYIMLRNRIEEIIEQENPIKPIPCDSYSLKNSLSRACMNCGLEHWQHEASKTVGMSGGEKEHSFGKDDMQ